jgi:hypothetical protein
MVMSKMDYPAVIGMDKIPLNWHFNGVIFWQGIFDCQRGVSSLKKLGRSRKTLVDMDFKWP